MDCIIQFAPPLHKLFDIIPVKNPGQLWITGVEIRVSFPSEVMIHSGSRGLGHQATGNHKGRGIVALSIRLYELFAFSQCFYPNDYMPLRCFLCSGSLQVQVCTQCLCIQLAVFHVFDCIRVYEMVCSNRYATYIIYEI